MGHPCCHKALCMSVHGHVISVRVPRGLLLLDICWTSAACCLCCCCVSAERRDPVLCMPLSIHSTLRSRHFHVLGLWGRNLKLGTGTWDLGTTMLPRARCVWLGPTVLSSPIRCSKIQYCTPYPPVTIKDGAKLTPSRAEPYRPATPSSPSSSSAVQPTSTLKW